jgi:hypothetical protein
VKFNPSMENHCTKSKQTISENVLKHFESFSKDLISKQSETSDRTALLVWIPARIEKMIRIPTELSGSCVTTVREIQPGVLTSSCVANVKGGTIPATVMNLNNYEVELGPLQKVEICHEKDNDLFHVRFQNPLSTY